MNTTYFLNLVAGNVFKTKTNPAIPTEYYIGLSTTAPNIDGTGVTQPTAGNYSRVKLALGEPVNGVVTNPNAVDFPESSDSWGTVTHFVIYDAQTNGNLLMYGALTASRNVEPSTIVSLRPGTITLSLVNPT